MKAISLKPNPGFSGSHIFVATERMGFVAVLPQRFDSERKRLLDHARRAGAPMAARLEATLIELPPDVLISEALSRTSMGFGFASPDSFSMTRCLAPAPTWIGFRPLPIRRAE